MAGSVACSPAQASKTQRLVLNPRNSLVLEFATALVHHNGPALVGFSVNYDYTWGKGYR